MDLRMDREGKAGEGAAKSGLITSCFDMSYNFEGIIGTDLTWLRAGMFL